MIKQNIINENIDKLKSYLSLLPIASALLVFLGFINYDLYYRKLDISIFSFLETSELLLSFINLIYPLAILGIAIIIHTYLLDFSDKLKSMNQKGLNPKKDQVLEKSKFDYSLNRILINLKKVFYEFKNKNFCISLIYFKYFFYGMFSFIVILIVRIFIILFGSILLFELIHLIEFNNLTVHKKFFDTFYFIGMSFIWVIFVFLYLAIKSDKNNYRMGLGLYTVIIFLILIANLNFYQNKLASNTYYDLNVKNVRFNYKGKNINTNDSKSLIGVTKNYLFLRETSKNENLIYKLSNITDLVFYYDDSLRKKDINIEEK